MSKILMIAEKPSVARSYAEALDMDLQNTKKNGYYEDDSHIVTWCVGHLVGMCYPEEYDPELKEWKEETIPFIPGVGVYEKYSYKYKILEGTKDQYKVVSGLLNRPDLSEIYYAGDSAREGEYIQRLVREKAGHNVNAVEKRLWIDSQTREEILNGLKNAKPLSFYDSLSDSAYARAIEDYLVGMNFSRELSLKYARLISNAAGEKYVPIAVGRVMSCVLGMIVGREREIRSAKVFPFYGLKASLDDVSLSWKIGEGSKYYNSPDIYNNQGFYDKAKADTLSDSMNGDGKLHNITVKNSVEKKQAPLLFNLAELQGECTKLFHISPAETLAVAQSLYEKKLTTYPRTDARVLTTALCKVFTKNISGLQRVPEVKNIASEIISKMMFVHIRDEKNKYVDDSKVSDHYAIIPTGEGFENLIKLTELERNIYVLIARRFLSIFYPAAEYDKADVSGTCLNEAFTGTFRALSLEGWLKAADKVPDSVEEDKVVLSMVRNLSGDQDAEFSVSEGKSSIPKRYTTGSMILAMENAGNLIDDPDLREQIKGSGIGTSATRADVIEKLEKNHYIVVNKKTQSISPDKIGEMIYDVLRLSLPDILNPSYTASWETGLQMIVDKKVSEKEYVDKINAYVIDGVNRMKQQNCSNDLLNAIEELKPVYKDLKAVDASGYAEKESVGICPVCGRKMLRGKFSFYCSGYSDKENPCRFSVYSECLHVKIPDKVVKSMIDTSKKQVDGTWRSDSAGPVKGFTSKSGKKFDAKLFSVYDEKEGKSKLSFDFSDNTPHEEVAKCPVCGRPILRGKFSFYCSGYSDKTNPCRFSVYSETMHVKLPDDVVKELVETSKKMPDGTWKSDSVGPVSGFVSKSGKPFDANLYTTYSEVDGKSYIRFDFGS